MIKYVIKILQQTNVYYQIVWIISIRIFQFDTILSLKTDLLISKISTRIDYK